MQILILLTLPMVDGGHGEETYKSANSSYLKVIKLSLTFFFSFPQIIYIFSDAPALQHAEIDGLLFASHTFAFPFYIYKGTSSLPQLIEPFQVCASALSHLQRTAFQLLIRDDRQLLAAQYFAQVHLKIHSINGELPEGSFFSFIESHFGKMPATRDML